MFLHHFFFRIIPVTESASVPSKVVPSRDLCQATKPRSRRVVTKKDFPPIEKFSQALGDVRNTVYKNNLEEYGKIKLFQFLNRLSDRSHSSICTMVLWLSNIEILSILQDPDEIDDLDFRRRKELLLNDILLPQKMVKKLKPEKSNKFDKEASDSKKKFSRLKWEKQY